MAPAANNNAIRRSEPTQLVSIASSHSSGNSTLLENYINTLNQMPNSSLSITPTKAKDKAIIDLTEDDETIPANVNSQYPQQPQQVQTQIELQQQRPSPTHLSSSAPSSSTWNNNQRRVLPSSAISGQCSSQIQYTAPRTATPTVVRASVSTSQFTSNKIRQAQPLQSKFYGSRKDRSKITN